MHEYWLWTRSEVTGCNAWFLLWHMTHIKYSISGYVRILTDLAGPKKWCNRFCIVRNGYFDCRKDISDDTEEFSFKLSGCEVSDAPETKRELAVKVLYEGQERFVIEVISSDNVTLKCWGCIFFLSQLSIFAANELSDLYLGNAQEYLY